MSLSDFKESITRRGIECLFDAPMREYTTFRLGGNADVLINPKSAEEIKFITESAKECGVPVCFVGRGSNILVRDGGVRGAVVRFGDAMSKAEADGEIICAESGISLARLACFAADNSLAGFEFASGIPGTLGGGIVMNAGAYKGEIKDVVFEVTALLPDGSIKIFSGEELDFSYRHSVFTDSGMLVLSAKLRLEKGDREEIRSRINDLSARRRTTQPLEYPSAGSAFKRPQNGYAAAMIDACGLKGFALGGAQVSEKHAGFVINRGNATAEDVENLLNEVIKRVYEYNGTILEREIIIIGEKKI